MTRLLPVTSDVYADYEHGGKDVEVRNDHPRWRKLLPGDPLLISCGYGTQHRIPIRVGLVRRYEGVFAVPDSLLRRARLLSDGDGRSVGVLKPGTFARFPGPVVVFEIVNDWEESPVMGVLERCSP